MVRFVRILRLLRPRTSMTSPTARVLRHIAARALHGPLALSAVLLVAFWMAARPAASGTDFAWQFDLVEAFVTPGCVNDAPPYALKVDAADRLVAAWSRANCLSRDTAHSGLKWGRRDAQTLQWSSYDIVDQSCGFLGCVGVRANPPGFALRPDGSPFYLYGREGPNEWIYVARANLEENPAAV